MTTGAQLKIDGTAGAQPVLLVPIREDLRLYDGPTQSDGAPSWRIYDPIRNAFFEIGWLEFELLARWKEHADAESLVSRVAAETPLKPALEEVEELIAFLAANLLLAPTSAAARQALARRLQSSKQTWYQQILHHYLFFRLPLIRPDKFLAQTVGLTDLFFTRGFALVVLVVLGIDLYLLSREWYVFTEALGRIVTPKSLVYYAIAVTFAKILHELGHAYAARRYGVRVPTMGVAFLVMAPFFYTDTGETWKLGDRRKQLVIACAGMATELVLAVFATLFWALSPEGAAKHVFFVLASTTWVMTLAINASPFMRFDGYFVLSDLLNFPNLHERAAACAKWWLRKTFFGLGGPVPEPVLSARQRAGLIVFAYVTWLYRLTVFLGIALLVYHLFFKLLGVFLMFVELIWFIALPIWREIHFLWQVRKSVHVGWRPASVVVLAFAAFVWMVPISNQVTAPAVLRAEQEFAVYAPFAARVTRVEAAEGEQVVADGELVGLQGADIEVRDRKADIAIASARAEIARGPASVRLQESYQVLQEQLAQALAEKQAVAEERERQQLRAPVSGTIRDVAPDLVAGRWVNPGQLLMRVVSETELRIEAYVGEHQIDAIEPSQIVHFYPQRAGAEVISGRVVAVDKSPQKELSERLLASVHGGDIAVKQSARGSLLAQEALFRVVVKPIGPLPMIESVVPGNVRIETDLRFVAENFVYRILSVLVRESGM